MRPGRAPHGARGLKLLPPVHDMRHRRRAPHGARGLKHNDNWLCPIVGWSRPARGAWIETRYAVNGDGHAVSRPARGAWIETSRVGIMLHRHNVAPRTGRVD